MAAWQILNQLSIYMHNKEVITEKKTEAVKSNYTYKPDCPLMQSKNSIKFSQLSGKNILRNQQ